MLVMCEEAAGMAKRFIRGIDVNPETLGRKLIEKVGPGGNFLQEDHTHKYFRKDHWIPTLMDRQSRDAWKSEGRKTMGDRIKKKIRHILETHKVPPLNDSIVEEITRLRRTGEQELVEYAPKTRRSS